MSEETQRVARAWFAVAVAEGVAARGRTEFDVAEETLYGFVVPLPDGALLTVVQDDWTRASLEVRLLEADGATTTAHLRLACPTPVAADALTSLLAWAVD